MTALVWDQSGERLYETGTDRGVLYLADGGGIYDTGFAWNGLTAVTEAPEGAEPTPMYADNIKYLNLLSYEEFMATIEAFTYPPQFAECDGTATPEAGVSVGQQPRRMFGFSYRTKLGNDLEGNRFGYKLHLVYGALASPSEKAYTTINDSPEAVTFSWEVSTTPVAVTGMEPTSIITIDSSLVDSAALATLEAFLYGGVSDDPSLPTPDEVIAIFSASVTTTAATTAPTYNSTTDIVTIPSITGVQYYTDADGDLAPGAMSTPIAATTVFKARAQAGYKLPPTSDTDWTIVFV